MSDTCFVIGRYNLAVTVYVPYKCTNKCSFCTSRKEYKGVNDDTEVTELLLQCVNNSIINEVVFTGGEPMENLKVLKRLLKLVRNKDVYINTTFIYKNIQRFIDLVNTTPWIRGINISRHTSSYTEDLETLKGIAPDKYIKKINKPVRINVVLQEEPRSDFILGVLNRWSKLDTSNVSVSFRADFNKVTPATLHALDDTTLVQLMRFGEYSYRTSCDVCDTTHMVRDTSCGIEYSYHRGLANTSIKFGDVIVVNDIIIFPGGHMCYDWDHKNSDQGNMMSQFGMVLNKNDRKKQEVRECGLMALRKAHIFGSDDKILRRFESSCGGCDYGEYEDEISQRTFNYGNSCGGGGC
jgi:hypothetical protein